MAGIGVTKTEQIYYRTLTQYLAPYSNFMDARAGSIQACADLIGQFGISADDCTSVRDAFAAVGLGSRTSFSEQLYLPLVGNDIASAPGFSGKVTLNGGPAAGVSIQLRRCDVRLSLSLVCSTIAAEATTDAAGSYIFPAGANIPNTDNFTWYRVMFVNPSNEPDGRMLVWFGDDIGAYVQGDLRRIDTFDIGDVTFVSPNTTTPSTFPMTFTWNARPVGGEYYYWELLDEGFEVIAMSYPFLMSTAPSITISSATDQQLVTGSSFAAAAYWDVVVVSRAGYGIPYNSGVVAFGSLASQAEALAARRALIERYANQARPPIGVER